MLHHPQPLDLTAMNAAATACLGQHDFTAFTPAKTEHVFFNRTVWRCEWEASAGMSRYSAIEADAFLRNMVRILVGTMLEIGRGSRPADEMDELVAGRAARRGRAARHLRTRSCLSAVRYPEPVDRAPILGAAE